MLNAHGLSWLGLHVMVTEPLTNADKEPGHWVVWMSHLAPETGKLKTNSDTINLLRRGLSQRTGSSDHNQWNKFPILSFLPISQSRNNHRSWAGAIVYVLGPEWGWLQHRVWPDYEEVLRAVGDALLTCKSAMAGYSHRSDQFSYSYVVVVLLCLIYVFICRK